VLKLSGFCLVVSFLVAPAAYSQTNPTPTASSPQAVTLAGQALSALSGSIRVSDVTLSGTGTRIAGSDAESGSVSLKALSTGQARLDLAVAGGTRSEIRNLDSNSAPQGFWIGLDGTTHSMANHNCATDAVWFFPAFSVLSQISNPNLTITYIGQETRGGTAVQHLRFVLQSPSAATDPADGLFERLSAEDVYLDATSSLPVALTFNDHPDNDALPNIPVEIDFSNYQAVNGARVPFRIQKFFNGSLLLDITIQSAVLNSGLSNAAFSVQRSDGGAL
jgi:hypothetical protein